MELSEVFNKISYRSVYNQIQLQNHIATTIADYAEQCGLAHFVEALDMNCGAIPADAFELVIDPDSPEQFLNLYSGIAHKRLAFAIKNMLEASKDFFEPVFSFVQKTGSNMEIGKLDSVVQGAQIFKSIVLDGIIEESKIIKFSEKPECLEWQGLSDSVKQIWEKSGANITDYFTFLNYFCAGIFESSSYKFFAQEDGVFKLELKSF